jgi:copper chaperone CopZ
MVHKYSIEGMTCGGCATTVQRLLLGVAGVIGVQVDLLHHEASVGAVQDVKLSALQGALAGTHYRITEPMPEHALHKS